MEGLYKNDEQQALDAIMTALQLLEGRTQRIHQQHQVKSGETGPGTELNGGHTCPNITFPNQSGHFASLSTPPNVPEGLAFGGDVTSAPGAGSSSDRGLERTGQVFSTSGVGDSSRVCQTYLGPVSDISDVGPVYVENTTATGALVVPLFVQRISDGVSMFDEDVDDPILHGRRQGPVSGETSTQPASKRKWPRIGRRMSVKAVQNIGKEQDRQKRIKARNIYHAQMSRRRRMFRQAVLEQEGLYKNDEQQALDAIMTALQLLEGRTQRIHQQHQVKSGETGPGTELNGGHTCPNITFPNQSGHFASLSTPPNVPEGLAFGGDVTSAPGAGSSSDRGLERTGQVFSTSGVGDSSRVCQTYLGPVSDISDVGPVYVENTTATGALVVPLFVQRISDGVSMFDEDVDDPILHGRRQGPVSGETSTQPASKRKWPRTGRRMSVKAVQNIGKEQDRQKRIKARNIYHAQMSRRRRMFRQAVLEQETAWLQRDISRLEEDIRCLSVEVDVFSDVLMNHSCPDVISDV